MIKFVGYFPDADEHTEGVILDLEMMLPSNRGYKGAPSPVAVTSALAAECRGAAYVIKLDNTSRTFAGTQTKLYELTGTTWTDVSKAGNYVGASDSFWRFAQFGDVTLAVNGTDEFQYSNGSGAFANLTGAPKAKVIDTIGGFVMVGNYNDGTDTPDGIKWSAYLDYTDWTPDIATQAGDLRLLDTPGEVRALKRLGQYAVAYKENSMYLGVNNGPPVLWGFTLVSGEIGAVSQEAVVSIETAHYFISDNDIFAFDGARPVSISSGIRESFFADLNADYAYKIRGIHDKNNNLIYWYYPSIASNGPLDSCIVYNYKNQRWGKADRNIEVCLEYLTGSVTYAGIESDYATYTDIPSVSYGSPFWTNASFNMAIVGADHIIYTLNGASTSSSLTTGAIGNDVVMMLMQRVQPSFTNDPTTGSMINYYRMTDGATYTTDATVALSSGRYDVLRDARWHKFKTSYTGDVEVIGHTYRFTQGGDE